MVFMPPIVGAEPVWNSDTDEVVVLAEAATGSTTVPPQCTYIVLALAEEESGSVEVYVSPDPTDQDSGIVMEADLNRVLGFAVAPGTVINFHTLSSVLTINVNVTRFYTKK